MPKGLSFFLYAEIALLAISTVYLPILEFDIWRYTTPAINVLALIMIIAFVRKIKFSEFILRIYCLVGLSLGSVHIFLMLLASNEINISVSRLLLLIESVILCGLYLFISKQSTQLWLRQN